MAHYFQIKLGEIYTHSDLVDSIGRLELVKTGSRVFLHIDFTNCFVFSDYLLLIVAIVERTIDRGVHVHIVCHGQVYWDNVKYAQRINFFNLMGIHLKEDFNRGDSNGRFIEISKLNKDNYIQIQDKIMLITKNLGLPDSTFAMLGYCFNEVIDNIFNHAEVENGWVTMQYFPQRKEIRLIIGDTGIGIMKALRESDEYKDIEEKDALENCIVRGVTNGKGQGFGLYATTKFTKENNGSLAIFSGNHKLLVNRKSTECKKSGTWPGTFVFLNAKCTVKVDHKNIVNNGFMEYFIDRINELSDENWIDSETLW